VYEADPVQVATSPLVTTTEVFKGAAMSNCRTTYVVEVVEAIHKINCKKEGSVSESKSEPHCKIRLGLS
jgi:hypothetical protein